MLIANPIYDVVFKYLMKDKKVAKLLLSAIIGEEIVDLDFRPTEQELKISQSWTVIRLDFNAKILQANGEEKLVIIEIQKAKLPSDIMRFRRYLGNQYADENNIITQQINGNDVRKALPILSIYFLGHRLEHTKAPVIKVARKYYDLTTQQEIKQKEEFIESLTHDSFIIQIPSLSGKHQTELEQILSVFDQDKKTNDKHILNFQEEDLPKKYRPLLRRLIAASSDNTIRNTMIAEDEIIEDFKNLERSIEQKEKELEEKQLELSKKDEQLSEKDEQLSEKDEQLNEKTELLSEKDEQLNEKTELLSEKDEQLNEKTELLSEKDEQLNEKTELLNEKDKALQAQQKLIEELKKKLGE